MDPMFADDREDEVFSLFALGEYSLDLPQIEVLGSDELPTLVKNCDTDDRRGDVPAKDHRVTQAANVRLELSAGYTR